MLLTPSIGWSAGGIKTLTYIDRIFDSNYAQQVMASGVEAGDLLIFMELNRDNGPPLATEAYPSGWTPIGTVGASLGNYTRVCASFKIANGTEDGTTITGMSEDQFWSGRVIQYRADKPLSVAYASTPVTAATTGNPSPLTIAASTPGTAPVLGIASYHTYSSSISPRTCSITPDWETSTSSIWYVQGYVQNSDPQDYTFDMDDEGSDNLLLGFYIYGFEA